MYSLANAIDASLVVSTVVGVILGGVITLLVSRSYYRKASDDLREAAGQLHKSVSLLGSAFENKEAWLQFRRNEVGEVVGLVIGVDAGTIRVGQQAPFPESPTEGAEC